MNLFKLNRVRKKNYPNPILSASAPKKISAIVYFWALGEIPPFWMYDETMESVILIVWSPAFYDVITMSTAMHLTCTLLTKKSFFTYLAAESRRADSRFGFSIIKLSKLSCQNTFTPICLQHPL